MCAIVADMNTLGKGQVRTIVFKEGATWYGVALEFNIVVEGDTYEVAHVNLLEAIQGYIASLKKIKGLRSQVVNPALNQMTDEEYERMWSKLQSNKPVRSPIQVKYYGVTRV